MLLFKVSERTINGVINYKAYALVGMPRSWVGGEIALLSKNKKDCIANEKQIKYIGIIKNICEDRNRILDIWPKYGSRWKYKVIFSDLIKLENPFNLEDILADDSRAYKSAVSQKKVEKKHEEIILEYINSGQYFPEEVFLWPLYVEGTRKEVYVNRYERNRKARDVCIKKYGYNCYICGFNFEENYGSIGHEYIHVHHIVPLSNIKNDYKINPYEDLIPICPNCHAMIHRGGLKTPKELKNIINKKK